MLGRSDWVDITGPWPTAAGKLSQSGGILMFSLGFPSFNRRHFLKHVAGFSATLASPLVNFASTLRAAAPQMKREGKSIIVLWMSGGPPTIDLWDPKFGEATAFD